MTHRELCAADAIRVARYTIGNLEQIITDLKAGAIVDGQRIATELGTHIAQVLVSVGEVHQAQRRERDAKAQLEAHHEAVKAL